MDAVGLDEQFLKKQQRDGIVGLVSRAVPNPDELVDD